MPRKGRLRYPCEDTSIKSNSIKQKVYDIKKKYNITYIEYLLLHIQQDFKCGICNKQLYAGRNKHIDHCHKTGKVRGLLCRTCNLHVGMVENFNLTKIEEYLKCPK